MLQETTESPKLSFKMFIVISDFFPLISTIVFHVQYKTKSTPLSGTEFCHFNFIFQWLKAVYL